MHQPLELIMPERYVYFHVEDENSDLSDEAMRVGGSEIHIAPEQKRNAHVVLHPGRWEVIARNAKKVVSTNIARLVISGSLAAGAGMALDDHAKAENAPLRTSSSVQPEEQSKDFHKKDGAIVVPLKSPTPKAESTRNATGILGSAAASIGTRTVQLSDTIPSGEAPVQANATATSVPESRTPQHSSAVFGRLSNAEIDVAMGGIGTLAVYGTGTILFWKYRNRDISFIHEDPNYVENTPDEALPAEHEGDNWPFDDELRGDKVSAPDLNQVQHNHPLAAREADPLVHVRMGLFKEQDQRLSDSRRKLSAIRNSSTDSSEYLQTLQENLRQEYDTFALANPEFQKTTADMKPTALRGYFAQKILLRRDVLAKAEYAAGKQQVRLTDEQKTGFSQTIGESIGHLEKIRDGHPEAAESYLMEDIVDLERKYKEIAKDKRLIEQAEWIREEAMRVIAVMTLYDPQRAGIFKETFGA